MKRNRKRISNNDSLEKRLSDVKKKLGFTSFEDKWNSICNEVKTLKLNY